MLRWTSAQNFA